MKKLIKALLCITILGSLVGCGNSSNSDFDPIEEFGCDVLNVYNWGEYIGEDTIKAFQNEYNVKVNYSMFDSNEMMYTSLLGGTHYDVLIPSDYMIERLIAEDLLQPIDYSIVTNMDLVMDDIKGLAYDPENTYSVPYFWGNVGIIYDTTVVDPADVESQGFAVFQNEKYKGNVYMYDSERDSFMIAFKALGYSMNTDNQDEIDEAYQWLLDVDSKVDPAYVTDEIIDSMINGEKALGIVYSGDGAYMISENEDLAFYLPEEGTNLWNDAMVIPKNSDCPKLANAFINFMLTHEVVYDNSTYVGYTAYTQEVYDELIGPGGDFEGNNAYEPRTDYELDEIFKYNDATKKILSDLWIKVKNQ